jgi:hypothetical protein
MPIPWDIVSQGGIATLGFTLTAFFIYQIFTGKWVPAKERDYWRDAFFVQQKITQDMEVLGQLSKTVLRSIADPPEDSK